MRFRAVNSYTDIDIIITTKDEPTEKGGDDYEIISTDAREGMKWVTDRVERFLEPGEVPTIGALEFFNHNENTYEEEPAGGFKPRFAMPDPFDMIRTSKSDGTESDTEIGQVEVSKLDEDKRLAFGWAYITHDKEGNLIVDKSGEYVDDPDELEKAAYNYVIKSRHQGDMHQRTMDNQTLPVGTMVESMVFTPEKIAKMGLPPGSLPTGWWVGFKVDSDDAWGAIKRGERKAFSIHGKAVRKEH